MAESNTENKPSAVVTDMRKHKRAKPKWLKWLLLVLLVLALALAVFFVYKSKKPSSSNTKEPDTVTVDGVTYKASFKTNKPVQDTSQEKAPSNQQIISDLEKKISDNKANSQDYLNLAQLYVETGDKAKAIDNYQKSIQAADSKSANYSDFVSGIQQIIKKLQAGN